MLTKTSFCQEEDLIDYFPHSVCDYWQYTTYLNNDPVQEDYYISKVTKDSLNNIYIYYNDYDYPTYEIDTNYIVNYLSIHSETGEILLRRSYYKIDAKQDEEWW